MTPISSTTNQRGFTMIELIMVIVILGVLAVFAAPMFNATMFNARGFHDETLSLLRHAQKSAIAQRRTVFPLVSGSSRFHGVDRVEQMVSYVRDGDEMVVLQHQLHTDNTR